MRENGMRWGRERHRTPRNGDRAVLEDLDLIGGSLHPPTPEERQRERVGSEREQHGVRGQLGVVVEHPLRDVVELELEMGGLRTHGQEWDATITCTHLRPHE